MVCLDNIWLRELFENLESESSQKKLVKIAFKVAQIKLLVMQINNQKLSFYIFMVRNVQTIFMEHDLYLIS